MYDIGVLQREQQTTYFRIHDLIGHCCFKALNDDQGREVANQISWNVRLIFISDIWSYLKLRFLATILFLKIFYFNGKAEFAIYIIRLVQIKRNLKRATCTLSN